MSKFKTPPNQDMDHLTRRLGASKKDLERQARRAAESKKERQESSSINDPVNPTEEPGGGTTETAEAETVELRPTVENQSEPEPETASVQPPQEPSTESRGSDDAKPRQAPRQSRSDKTAAPQSLQSAAIKMVGKDVAEIQGYIYAPLTGASPTYDKLVSLYGEREAMRVAIDAGLEELDRKLAAGEPVEPVMDLSTKKKRTRMQRKMSAAAADRALSYVDPLGVLSQFRFATRLYKTALGLYLAKG